MSDQNVVKEGWVQKRGEDSPSPSGTHNREELRHFYRFSLHPILFC